MPKISCIASFSPHFLFLFRTRCFLASSLFFLSICCFVTFRKCLRPERSSSSSCSCSTCTRNEMPEGSKFKRQPEKGQCDGRQRREGEQLQHVAWRGGVVQSIYRHVHSLQVCAAVATPAGMADYVPPRLRASLLASSGSLAPTWPLTTSKSAKCQVFALVSSPATYIPCAAAPHTPPPLSTPPPSPCFTACFCWRFLPPNFGAVTFFSALSFPRTHTYTAQPVPVPVPSNVLRCPLLFVHYCCCLFFLPCTCWLLFYAHRFSLSAFYLPDEPRTDRAGFAVCSCLFARRLFMCRNWSGSF